MLATFLQTALGYLREIAEIIVLGFVVAGVITAIVNKEKEAVARQVVTRLACDMQGEEKGWR